MKSKVLFVCNQNKNRSKTAEELFKGQFDTRSAGLYCDTNQLSREQVLWAKVIVVFEDAQKEEILRRFPIDCRGKRIIDLAIPDIYDYMVPPLIAVIKKRMDETHIYTG
ncbi:MAG: phosphotyrosine protein phosphatase [Candidatus Micrarchaeota archaeon]